jgi:L-methionine (R)-S-oxide reductase
MSTAYELPNFGHPPERVVTAEQKAAAYRELDDILRALLAGEHDPIANFANASALLFQALPQLNWAGFYLLAPTLAGVGGAEVGKELVLGPFQGKPACVRIALGRGVCGTAAATRQTQLVPNVHEFPGHIACDSASNSEIVVPLLQGSGASATLIGVLDLDSPVIERFDAIDKEGLERLAATIVATLR